MKKILVMSILFLSLCLDAAAYNLTASVESPQVQQGQRFVLTVRADDSISESPDLSVLQKDFRVVSTNVSRQTSYNNGRKSATTQWQIGLLPVRLGPLNIPAVKVGSESTMPLSIEVVEGDVNVQNQQQAQPTENFTITAEMVKSDKPIYVQQQIIYNVTIVDDGSLQSGEPIFQTGNTSDWIIKSLGQPEISVLQNGSKEQRVINYKYALFPQKSGQMKIPEVIFQGTALGGDLSSNFAPFGEDLINISINLPSIFAINRPVQMVVPAKEIEVMPVPENYRGQWWLPAEKVTLRSSWGNNPTEFRVGEAVTRNIVLEAVGVNYAQLPELKSPSDTLLKQYQQSGQSQENLVDGRLVSTETTQIVYVPRQAGEVVVPEISVDWFDVNTGKFEKASLDATEIFVQPSTLSVPETEQQSSVDIAEQSTQNIMPEALPAQSEKEKPLWPWFILTFVSGVFCSALLLKKRIVPVNKPQCEMRAFPDFIEQKAYQNDYRALRDALMTWAVGYYPQKQINNLQDIAEAAQDKDFSRQIDILLAKLYQSDSTQIWNAKIFVDAFRKISVRKQKEKKNNMPLPPLYD